METTTSENPLIEQDQGPHGDVVIKCIQLSKVFRDFWMRNRVRAVDEIDLEVYRGEVFGLLGPNGSGKSTTIKLILGLLYPTSGRVIVMGKTPQDVANKKSIGYLPEETYLYKFLNARETLDYYGRLFNLPKHTRKSRIDELLRQVELEHAQYRPVGELSKGMQRKVGLAQALINDPDLLILDEPTSGMDPIATASVKRLIKILASRGKTILLCSHLLADVEDVCERAAIMFGGKVRETGTIDDLLIQQDLTTIKTPHLDPQTIEKIERVLEEDGKHIDRVEQPRQSLEAKFLHIVQTAKSESGSGSHRAKVAEFLSQAEDSEEQSVINRLLSSEAESKSTAGPPPAEPPPVPAAPQHDESAISELMSASPPETIGDAQPIGDQTSEPVGQSGQTDQPDQSTEAPPQAPSPTPQATAEPAQPADLSVIDNLVAPQNNEAAGGEPEKAPGPDGS